jgi:DNA-directed RNA polymerase specialized sigma24 family protein
MHHVEAIPYETMSELLDVSVSALKMRVLRAREALAAALTAQDCEVTELNPARLSVRRG